MSVTEQIERIGMGGDVGEVQEEAMDIIEFCESSVGLGMDPDSPGISLYPVQKFILKCYYNIPLNDTDPRIVIPKDWRYLDSDKDAHFHEFTEQEYLEYLYDRGRANIDELNGFRRVLILPIGRRSGKCVTPDTLVPTGEGMFRIGDLGDLGGDKVQDLDIEIAQEDGSARTDKFYNGEVRETKRVESEYGYTIEGTLNHRVRVLSDGGDIEWRYLEDIEEGDWLCIQRHTDLWRDNYLDVTDYHNDEGRKEFHFPDQLTEQWGRMLGLLSGDGTWNVHNRTEITFGPYPELESALKAQFESLFGDYSVYDDTSRIVCHGLSLRTFLADIGWDVSPDEKSIPWSILRSPKSVVASYLSGLFEADGSVSSGLTLSAKDRGFLDDIQTVLLNFGVVCSVDPKSVDGQTYWRLSVRGHESLKLFLEEIGFLTDRKQSALETLVENGRGGKSDFNSIPNQTEKVRSLVDSCTKYNPLINGEEQSGHNRTKVRNAAGNVIKPKSDESLTYNRIRDIIDLESEVDLDSELLSHFKDLLDQYYFFDRVKTTQASESKVCDLSVPGNHQFVANGFTNHNTFLNGIIGAYETYKLLRKKNPQRYYGLPEHAEIHISSIATSRDQAKLLFREIQRNYSACKYFNQYQTKETQTYAAFQTPYDKENTGDPDDGGKESLRITFHSSVSKGIRGTNNIVVSMDEAAFFPKGGEKSAKAVYDAAAPSTASFSKGDSDRELPADEGGKIIMISSPFTKEGLFYDKYEESKSGYTSADSLLMIQAPTWEVNPSIDQSFLQEQFHDDPEVFEREFGAKFTSRSENWIDRESNLQVCINKDLKPKTKGQARVKHYLGMDLAVKGDMTSMVLTRPVDDETIRLVYHELWQAGEDWYRLNPHLDEPIIEYPRHMPDVEALDFDKMADWLEALSDQFYIEEGMFDRWNGEAFKQKIDKRGFDSIEMKKFSRNEISTMFKAFKQMMLHESVEMYDHIENDDFFTQEDNPPYVQELLELESTKKTKNITLVEAPDVKGKHDDFADALVRSFYLSLQSMTGDDAKQKVTAGVSKSGGKNRTSRGRRRSRRRRPYNKKRY